MMHDMMQIPVSSTAPANPTNGQMWIDQSGDNAVLRQYMDMATTYNATDLVSALNAQQADLWCTLQTQTLLSMPHARSAYVAEEPVWTKIAHPYVIPQCCCEAPDPLLPRKTNCRNCGAPVTRSGFCEYCNTYN